MYTAGFYWRRLEAGDAGWGVKDLGWWCGLGSWRGSLGMQAGGCWCKLELDELGRSVEDVGWSCTFVGGWCQLISYWIIMSPPPPRVTPRRITQCKFFYTGSKRVIKSQAKKQKNKNWLILLEITPFKKGKHNQVKTVNHSIYVILIYNWQTPQTWWT